MLRQSLRERTRLAHDRVDAVFGDYDLADERDYGAFLLAHHEALTSLPLEPSPYELPPVRLTPLLRADLAMLGATPSRQPTRSLSDDEALGAYYVVAGSRLGAQVLLNRWQESRSLKVLASGRYLLDRNMLQGWKALNALLADPLDVDLEAVVRGAAIAFASFEAAGRRYRPGGESDAA